MSQALTRLAFQAVRLYWRLARPNTRGSRALVVRQNRVRLVRLTYVDGWYLPGGGVDRGESFEAAVIRELREECAIEAVNPRLFGMYHSQKGGKKDEIAIFVVDDFTEIAGANPDREIAEQQEFPLNALPEGATPATRRRVQEYLAGAPANEIW